MGLKYIFLNKALLLYVLGLRVIIQAKKSLRRRRMSRDHGRHQELAGMMWLVSSGLGDFSEDIPTAQRDRQRLQCSPTHSIAYWKVTEGLWTWDMELHGNEVS